MNYNSALTDNNSTLSDSQGISSDVNLPKVDEKADKNYYFGNFHMHTKNSDGANTYDEMVNESVALGFDFIAITDHRVIATREQCLNEKRILCIPAEEVYSSEGYILAIGINGLVESNRSAEDTINQIHAAGGVAIAAHPNRVGANSFSSEKIATLPFDAVECSIRGRENDMNLSNYPCLKLPNYPYVFDSDAHNINQLATLANKCLLEELTIESVIKAIKEGNCFEYFPEK